MTQSREVDLRLALGHRFHTGDDFFQSIGLRNHPTPTGHKAQNIAPPIQIKTGTISPETLMILIFSDGRNSIHGTHGLSIFGAMKRA
jgi:hypothetical protein